VQPNRFEYKTCLRNVVILIAHVQWGNKAILDKPTIIVEEIYRYLLTHTKGLETHSPSYGDTVDNI